MIVEYKNVFKIHLIIYLHSSISMQTFTGLYIQVPHNRKAHVARNRTLVRKPGNERHYQLFEHKVCEVVP